MATSLQAPPPSGVVLYERKVKMTIAPPVIGSLARVKTQQAIVVDNLRIEWKGVTKSLRKEPNTGTINVYNLNPTHRAQLQDKGARVWLEAGYTSGTFLIFAGDVRFIEHSRPDADWVCKMELGDGERVYRYGRCNVSFKGGTTAADVLKELARQSGWDLGNVSDFYASLSKVQHVNGYSTSGSVARAIDETLEGQGLSWSVQNNAIQILPLTGYIPGTAVQVDVAHGLVGSPAFGSAPKPGQAQTLKFKTLLQAGLDPGKLVNLQSDAHNGVFIIQKAELEGDTHGDDWYVSCEATPAGGSKKTKARKAVGKR